MEPFPGPRSSFIKYSIYDLYGIHVLALRWTNESDPSYFPPFLPSCAVVHKVATALRGCSYEYRIWLSLLRNYNHLLGRGGRSRPPSMLQPHAGATLMHLNIICSRYLRVCVVCIILHRHCFALSLALVVGLKALCG